MRRHKKPASPETEETEAEIDSRPIPTTEEEIYGCPPCAEYPDGLIGLGVLVQSLCLQEQDRSKEVKLKMLPYGRGKLIGSE